MSRRDRKKPPSQRSTRRDKPAPGRESPRATESVSCRLCGAPADLLGFWTPVESIARFFTKEVIGYTLCSRCVARPESGNAVEESLLAERMAEVGPVVNPPADEWDTESLNRISTYGGVAVVDGVAVPLVIPSRDVADRQGFDRQVCAADLRKFLRPFLDDALHPCTSHVLVEELSPGVRVRKPIEYFPYSRLN